MSTPGDKRSTAWQKLGKPDHMFSTYIFKYLHSPAWFSDSHSSVCYSNKSCSFSSQYFEHSGTTYIAPTSWLLCKESIFRITQYLRAVALQTVMSHGRVIAEQGHPAISSALGKQIGEKPQSPRLEAVISLTHSPYSRCASSSDQWQTTGPHRNSKRKMTVESWIFRLPVGNSEQIAL